MTIPESIRDNIALVIFSTLFGALITFIITKVTRKTARMRYSTSVERVALAADDPTFGSVRVTWRNESVRNLYLATLEIENTSTNDFENIEFKVTCSDGTLLLGERTSVGGTSYAVDWSQKYSEALLVPPNGAPTPEQWNIYSLSREYTVRVLNRGQLLHLNYLCTRPNDDLNPVIFLSTQIKGAKLKYQSRSNLVHGIPTQVAVVDGVSIAALTTIACGLIVHSPLVASIICVVVGLFAQSIGAVEYKLRTWLWKLLAG